jgi:ferrous iron transport protein A
MTPLSLAEAVTGLCVRIIAVNLEGEAAAWLAAVGLHEGEELVVLRRAALGGPLHVRTGGGGEFAVAREVAQRIGVSVVDHPSKSVVTP